MTSSATPLKQYLINLIRESVVGLRVFALGLHKDRGRSAFSLAFDCGQDVDFGAVAFSREGTNLDDCIIPWSALRSFCASNREIIFVRQCGNRFESVFGFQRLRPATSLKMLYLVEVQVSAKQHQLTH